MSGLIVEIFSICCCLLHANHVRISRIIIKLAVLILLNKSTIAWAVASPSVAFFYGDPIPQELITFDVVVVQPEHVTSEVMRTFGNRLFAYVSVGEIEANRNYARLIPQTWLLGGNKAWGSQVIDQTQADWPDFFVNNIIAPLWQRGFRGFFLDTLDSYQLYAKSAPERTRQEQGLIRLITAIKNRYPEAKLFFNRGFELLQKIHPLAYAVAAESLFQGWNNSSQSYITVATADRDWLLTQLNKIKDEYYLPVVVIDYVSSNKRALMRETAKKIKALGFIPWIANPSLDSIGMGALEIVPRRIAMLYNGKQFPSLMLADIHRFVAMPLNYLGYIPEYFDISEGLPTYSLIGRYAGIVSWMLPGATVYGNDLQQWLLKQVHDGVRVAVFNDFGFPLTNDLLAHFDLVAVTLSDNTGIPAIVHREPQVGFEIEPGLNLRDSGLIKNTNAKNVWLRYKSTEGKAVEPVAITHWGGYALTPFAINELPAQKGIRWVIDPFAFLTQALELPAIPVPDTTTENGRRLLFAHIDGDGFANRAEFPGSPFAPEVLLRDVLKKYPIPTTVSVIQGEIARNGLYPTLSGQLEAIAKQIFALPYIEIASHSYSHPFKWGKLETGVEGEAFNLAIPRYKFDEQTEIDGSINYINKYLAPPGKRTKVFLWTGDCNPGYKAVGRTIAAGVYNMNGGDTTITRSDPTLTSVAALGVPKGDFFQVYAANQNENVYTGLWTGPYYGYERVIETFELTDTPRRLKPIDIYYHTYSTSKLASLRALDKVYQWALWQPVLPIYSSEYIRKVQDFNRLAVARDANTWIISGADNLRTLRIAKSQGYPDLDASPDVIGYGEHGNDRYLYLSGKQQIKLSLQDTPPTRFYLEDANGTIKSWQRTGANTYKFDIAAHVPLQVTLNNVAGCNVQFNRLKSNATKTKRIVVDLQGKTDGNFDIHC